MMHRNTLIGLCTGLVLSGAAAGQDLTCADVEFTEDALANNPEIQRACQDVVVRDGRQFAKLEARVVRSGNRRMTLRYKLDDGSFGKAYQTDELPSDFRVVLDGRSTRPRELQRGQDIRVYVEIGGQFAISVHDVDEEVVEPVPVVTTMTEVEEEVVAEPEPEVLPTTASPLPLFGLLGAGLLGMASLLRIARRRQG